MFRIGPGLKPQSSFRRTCLLANPAWSNQCPAAPFHISLLSTTCNRLSVSKTLQELLFLCSSPCWELPTCSFTSSPPLTALRTRLPGGLLYIHTTSFPSCSSREEAKILQAPPHSRAHHHCLSPSFPRICFPVVPQIPRGAAMSPAPLPGLPMLLPVWKSHLFLRHKRMISSSDSGYPGMSNIF